MKTAKDYTLYELLAVNISKMFRDDDVGFTGLVTGDQTAVMASMAPLAAMSLAQHTHAPNMTVLLAGMLHNPDLSKLTTVPNSEFEPTSVDVDSEAMMLGFPAPWCVNRGDITVGFSSGAQIDAYGNMNSVCIGDHDHPKVRLVGAIFQTEHLALFGREIITMKLEKRKFVEKVDFVSAVGYPGGREGRAKLGLSGAGPEYVVTDKCIFNFHEVTGRMQLYSIHPGYTPEDIRNETGFPIENLYDAKETPAPTEEELYLLRNIIDPKGLLLPRSI